MGRTEMIIYLGSLTLLNLYCIMKRYIYLNLLFIALSFYSCHTDSKNRSAVSSKTNSPEAFISDSIIDIEISESNKKFRINDSMAVALVQQVREIRQIINYRYEDTTIFNQIHIENVPTDSDKNWQINIVQFHPKTEHVTSLMWLLVDANDGKIRIHDIPKDTIMPLDTWLKIRTRK